jgi:hypothetical protein
MPKNGLSVKSYGDSTGNTAIIVMNAYNTYYKCSYFDDDKNKETNLLWESMPTKEKKTGNVTNREFLEYFGTKIVRKIKPEAWVEATMNNILKENSEIAIIPDVRFPNEVNAIKNAGGKVIRLTRNIHDSKIECETALDEKNFDWSLFDHVIDNSNSSIEDLCSSVNNLKQYWN